ncbi:MAG: TIR domain-containing protein [Proteobacteria bacterium]|nr:TIR domain-containing protein [Pseudomonadota bacterium]
MSALAGHAVFLSYASQDADAARRICDALRAAGIEVWFDQSELRGGDAWDQKIRNQIRDCALFVPIISEHTASRPEGYFRLEWAIADHRTQMIARNKAFIVPVCVDNTRENIADLPDSFHRAQWTRLPAGETPPSFCRHIATLLGGSEKTGAAPAATEVPVAPVPHPQAPGRSRWLLLAAATVLIAAAVILRPWRVSAPVLSQTDAPVAAAQPGAAPERSIAVLPFTDMSEKKDQEYFSDGLSEELIDMLTKVPDLRVPARTSSFYFKGQHATIAEIARALGVSHVLEGSVRKSGNTLRVTAQLIRADNGYHVWSETYDRAAQDIFKVQDEIAARVVDALKVSLPAAAAAGTGRPENAQAYNEYLLGVHFMDRGSPAGYASAEQALRRAIKLDPNYAAAYARLALAEAYWSDQTGDDSGLKRATADVEHAITLAPNQPDGYFARGYLRVLWLWNFEGAGADLERAVALEPNNAAILEGYSLLLESRGDLPGAIAAVDKAVRLDPLRVAWWQARGLLLIASHDLPGARLAYQRCLELDPENIRAVAELAIIDMLAGQPRQGLTRLRNAPTPPGDPGGWSEIAAAMIQHSLGNEAESRRALDVMVSTASRFAAFQIAEIHAWRGEKDQAFAWLDRAFAQRDGGLTRIRTDPLLDSLRSDPRFAAFLAKLHLPR